MYKIDRRVASFLWFKSKNIFIILTFWRLTLCRTFDPLSFDPLSFDPMPFDPVSFDLLSVNQKEGGGGIFQENLNPAILAVYNLLQYILIFCRFLVHNCSKHLSKFWSLAEAVPPSPPHPPPFPLLPPPSPPPSPPPPHPHPYSNLSHFLILIK